MSYEKKPQQLIVKFCEALSTNRLAKTKKAALRSGVWFRAINKLERCVVDLTLKCVQNIKSIKLAKVVAAILIKLEVGMESKMERAVRLFGRSLAQKMSSLAMSWGNLAAASWAVDCGFARYLAFNIGKIS